MSSCKTDKVYLSAKARMPRSCLFQGARLRTWRSFIMSPSGMEYRPNHKCGMEKKPKNKYTYSSGTETRQINPLGPKITYKIYSTGIHADNCAPTACIAAR